MRVLARVGIVTILLSAALAADERIVLVERGVDFSRFRTFLVHDGGITSRRPELIGSPVMPAIAQSIRQALIAGGLTERATSPDLAVEFSVHSVDFNVGPFGVVRPLAGQRGGRRGPERDPKIDFTETTLVIDARRDQPQMLIWRAVYRLTDDDTQPLLDALPKNAARLASELLHAK
jgi:hypothetical protein